MACKDQRSNDIRRKLHEISYHLTTDDLKQFKFLAPTWFDNVNLESIDSVLGFFNLVIDLSESNDEIVRYVISLLNAIKKRRLAAMLKACMYYGTPGGG